MISGNKHSNESGSRCNLIAEPYKFIEPKIFREYDIRGVWGDDLTPDAVKAIGKAYALYLKQETSKDRLTVSVGRDTRLSSPAVFDQLTEGLLGCGIDVIDLGICPTPLLYFSLYNLAVDGGIMVTGSHNPPEFNGLKLCAGRESLYGDSILKIRDLTFSHDNAKGSGRIRSCNIIPAYVSYMENTFKQNDGVKVVVDSGNGTGGLVAPAILRQLGCKVTELFSEPDGGFPNHHPDPTVPDNLKALIAAVRAEKADVGIGYDGDADRIGVVDEEGGIIWGDKLLLIFARDILERNPGAAIIGEVKCSKTLFDDIKAHGGRAIMWKTGHSLIKSKLKETGGLLAGEMSGHIFFADRYFGYDDAIYASLRIIEILAERGKPYSLKSLLKGIPETFSTPEIRLECPDDKKFSVVERAKTAFSGYPLTDIDGIRINFDNGWALIRASNTQPALVMRFEAKDTESLDRIRNCVEGKLREIL